METTSVHVDKYGTVLGNYNDGDNSVYEHDKAKSSKDYKKDYNAKTNTGAGGKKIGELGGKIDATNIFKNLLDKNIKFASSIVNPLTFRNLVKGHGDWDLKNNTSTIYGVANGFDKANGTSTIFQFNGGQYSAPDIGNYHFGATGAATWFGSDEFLLRNAGAAQMAAGTSLPEWQKYRNISITDRWGNHDTRREMLPPYGDDPYDQKMIKEGINYENQNKP